MKVYMVALAAVPGSPAPAGVGTDMFWLPEMLLTLVLLGVLFGLPVFLLWRAIRLESIRDARQHYRTMRELLEEERRRIQANPWRWSPTEQERHLRDHDLSAEAQLARIRDFACEKWGCDPNEITGIGRGGY